MEGERGKENEELKERMNKEERGRRKKEREGNEGIMWG